MFQKSVSPTLHTERAKARHARQFLCPAERAGLSKKSWGSSWTKRTVTVLSSCFSTASGRRERVPGSPCASTSWWSESRGGQAPGTPLRDGGLRVSPPERTVSTARNCPATKNSHVRVCGPRVHTRNKTQTHEVSGTRVSSVVTQCRHDRHELLTRVCAAPPLSQTRWLLREGRLLRPPFPSVCSALRCFRCSYIFVTRNTSLLAPNASVARRCCSSQGFGNFYTLPESSVRKWRCGAHNDSQGFKVEDPFKRGHQRYWVASWM